MKVLGIVGSPRKGGNTEIMMEAALAGARSYGAETELWTAAGKDLNPCDACDSCSQKGGECHIKDDMQELYPKIIAADGLIFGSPVYFLSLTAQAKIIMDRLYCQYNQYRLVDKVAGVIGVARARGHDGVWDTFRNFIDVCHMLPADFATGFASAKGEVKKDDYAMKCAEELGKQVASLIKQQFHCPEEYRRPLFRVCREKYGIDSYPLRHLRQVK